MAAWGAQGDTAPGTGVEEETAVAEGTPGLSPPRPVTTSPLPPTAPHPSRALPLSPVPSGPHPSAPALREEEEARERKRRHILEQGSLEQSWSLGGHRRSCKTHRRGLRRDEPPHPTGTAPSPAWGHPVPGQAPTALPAGTRTCCTSDQKVQNEKYNGKSKNSVRVQPLARGRRSSRLETLSSWFWSKDVTLVTQELREGLAVGAASLVGTPSNKLSECGYIYNSIYLSLSISLSHAALGIEEEQRAKVRMGAPACREQGHPEAHSHPALASTSGFFLAYIRQQYRNSAQHPEPWPRPSGGCSAGTPAVSQPELPMAPTIAWLSRDVPGCPGMSCLAWGSLPSGQGERGGTVSSLPLLPRWSALSPRRVFPQLSPFLHPQLGLGATPALGHPALTPGSATTLVSTGKGQVTGQRRDPLPPREAREERTRALA